MDHRIIKFARIEVSIRCIRLIRRGNAQRITGRSPCGEVWWAVQRIQKQSSGVNSRVDGNLLITCLVRSASLKGAGLEKATKKLPH